MATNNATPKPNSARAKWSPKSKPTAAARAGSSMLLYWTGRPPTASGRWSRAGRRAPTSTSRRSARRCGGSRVHGDAYPAEARDARCDREHREREEADRVTDAEGVVVGIA